MRILKTALVVGFVVASFNIHGQDESGQTVAAPDSLMDNESTDLSQYLPPLSILIDSAIANSTEMELADLQIMMSEYEVARGKKDWADIVSISAQYRLSEAGIAQVEDGIFFPASDGPTTGYVVGVGFRLPLSYFTTRKDRLQMTKLNVDLMEAQKEAVAREVKEKVIQAYNQLLLLQRLIKISTEAKEFSELIFEMSEERFRDGELSLDQMGANTSLKARYATEYEQLRTEFSNTYALLERLVGAPLSKLQQN